MKSIHEISCQENEESWDEEWYESESEEIDGSCEGPCDRSDEEIHESEDDGNHDRCEVSIDRHSRCDIGCHEDSKSCDEEFDKKWHIQKDNT